MRQTRGGNSRTPDQRELPTGSQPFAETTGWRAHLSVDEGCLVLEPLDYHPGLLILDVEDLERALAALRAGR